MFGSCEAKSGQFRMTANQRGKRAFLTTPIDKRFRP